jgi:hypothetical protein
MKIEKKIGPLVDALHAAVLDGKGKTDPELRRAAFNGAPDDPRIARFVEKVRSSSYTVTALDVDELRSAGLGEDAIFEITLAAALGEGARRLNIGLSLLRPEI